MIWSWYYCTNRFRCDCWARSVNLRNRSIDRTALLKNLLVVQQLVARARSRNNRSIAQRTYLRDWPIELRVYLCEISRSCRKGFARSTDCAGMDLPIDWSCRKSFARSTDHAGKVLHVRAGMVSPVRPGMRYRPLYRNGISITEVIFIVTSSLQNRPLLNRPIAPNHSRTIGRPRKTVPAQSADRDDCWAIDWLLSDCCAIDWFLRNQ